MTAEVGRVDVLLWEPETYEAEARRALAMARALPARSVRTLILTEKAEGPAGAPAEGEVVAVRCPDLSRFDAAALAEGLAALLQDDPPQVVVCSEGHLSSEAAPVLAGKLGFEVLLDVAAIRVDGEALLLTRSAFGGKASVCLEAQGAPMVLGAGLFTEAEAQSRTVEREVALSPPPTFLQDVRRSEAPPGGVKDAQVVVAGGRGIGGKEGLSTLEELAAKLRVPAAVGASRAAVDEGWARPEQQVGLTGAKVSPAVYIAVGISGASQHLAGIAGAGQVLAVNRDEQAPIVSAADITFIADWNALWPAVKNRLEAASG